MSDLPAWLVSLTDQRIALIEETMGDSTPTKHMILTALAEPKPDATSAELDVWERSCDHCKKYCPPGGDDFYTGHVMRSLRNGTPVYITLGVCAEHIW